LQKKAKDLEKKLIYNVTHQLDELKQEFEKDQNFGEKRTCPKDGTVKMQDSHR